MTITIRPETSDDIPAIREVNMLAFGQAGEANLVDALRRACPDALSLVAVSDGTIVGHVLFTPVTLDSTDPPATGYGLGPVAVLPNRQRQGIGSMLIREGLRQLDASGCPFTVVLGHPDYYPRFGFTSATPLGIRCKWDVPEGAFMIRFLDPAHPLPVRGRGMVEYHEAFDSVT